MDSCKFAKTISLKVRIINRSPHQLPAYATSGSSGMDLRAFIEGEMVMNPFQRILVPTGIFLEMENGLEAQIRPRSGLALKQGITCLNSPGTIDADYRGEIKVLLINLSNELQVIHNGDRIAQMVFQDVVHVQWEETEVINETARNEGGFGHTGKQ